jgi:hypothetical protein
MIMYEIRDELDQLCRKTDGFPAAERAMDDLCAQAHAQAVASGEGTSDLWHRFAVIDTATGEEVAFRSYNPDPSTPYVPLNQEET